MGSTTAPSPSGPVFVIFYLLCNRKVSWVCFLWSLSTHRAWSLPLLHRRPILGASWRAYKKMEGLKKDQHVLCLLLNHWIVGIGKELWRSSSLTQWHACDLLLSHSYQRVGSIEQSFLEAFNDSCRLPLKFKENWVPKHQSMMFPTHCLFSSLEWGWNNVATFKSQFLQALSWLLWQ